MIDNPHTHWIEILAVYAVEYYIQGGIDVYTSTYMHAAACVLIHSEVLAFYTIARMDKNYSSLLLVILLLYR